VLLADSLTVNPEGVQGFSKLYPQKEQRALVTVATAQLRIWCACSFFFVTLFILLPDLKYNSKARDGLSGGVCARPWVQSLASHAGIQSTMMVTRYLLGENGK
jgi:hypothetical protein